MIGNTGATNKPDTSVHDQQLAVRAVVDLRQQVGTKRVIPLNAPTGIGQRRGNSF